jgi:uncharacterized protein (TIGR00290 family)
MLEGVGHISPGRCKAAKSGANPVLSRNCDAPRGRARSTACDERTPALGGRAVRAAAAAGPSPPLNEEVFISEHSVESQPRPSRRPSKNAATPATTFALSWSGGKDSALALWRLRREQFEPEALITTVTESYDRISMHGVRRELLAQQAQAVGLPLVEILIPPACVNDVYEARMAQAFAASPLSGVDAVAFGDLFLEDVRVYREQRLAAAGKRGLFPLWGKDTGALAREFLDAGFEATLVCVDPRMLDRSFAGRRYDKQLLAELPAGVDPCGENGEFHTFVHGGPIFETPIACATGEVVERDGFVFCDLIPIEVSASNRDEAR